MWKYKLSCPFGGYEEIVVIIAALSMLSGFPIHTLAETQDAPAEMIPFFYVMPVLVVLLIAFCIAHYKSPADREKIRSAEPLQWESADRLTLSDRMENTFLWYVAILIIMGLLVLTSLAHGYFLFAAIFAGMFVLLLLVTLHEYRFWSDLDETAETVLIPVDHFSYVYSLNTEKHSRRFLDKYAILTCYLPDGRYRFKIKTDIAPDAVRIVRCRHRYRIWM